MVLGTALTLLWVAGTFGQEVTGAQVRQAVEAAKDYLLRSQRLDGSWDEYRLAGGTTAMAALALLNAGVPLTDARLESAVGVVRRIPLEQTYVVSLKIQALVAADPKAYQTEIRAAAEWLIKLQHENGMWGYGLGGGRGDFSNTQFALLGLHEAANAGVVIPQSVWRQAELAWTKSQLPDGGWAYMPKAPRGTGSMTAAGIASLYITGNSLSMPAGHRPGSNPPCCGRYTSYRPIARGLTWLDSNFSVSENPGAGGWYFYYLYGLERVGILSGLPYIGRHDWYREAAARLVQLQEPGGQWREIHPVVDTAFGLLFLAKGHRAVLVHKLKWSNDERWNVARNDLAHLVAFLGDRLGQPVGWEAIPLDAEVTDWLRAPILYISGKVFPALKPADTRKLLAFIQDGGTILADAACSSKVFHDGFAQFVHDAFPEYELIRLPPEHPVFRTLFPLDGKTVELHGLAMGCRTSLFFSPGDLSCLWEYGDVPKRSRAAFELGANIAAYATGLEPLPDKLDAARVARRAQRSAGPAAEIDTQTPPRGALYIAQLMHNGDWRPNPRAIPNLAGYLLDQMAVDVVRRFEPLKATDPLLAQHPVVYMTGHYTFKLSPEEVAALRQHIRRGGFLLANACCGRLAFDTAFRDLASQMFPEQPLERLRPDHPIITGSPGIPLPTVTYRPALAAERRGLNQVWLEGITLDGRTVVVYSPFSLDCGLDGHACFACRGLEPPDARKVAANVILYALSH